MLLACRVPFSALDVEDFACLLCGRPLHGVCAIVLKGNIHRWSCKEEKTRISNSQGRHRRAYKVKLPQQELGASIGYKLKSACALRASATSPDMSLEFYSVVDRIPRVYPWMNEPGGGIMPSWNT